MYPCQNKMVRDAIDNRKFEPNLCSLRCSFRCKVIDMRYDFVLASKFYHTTKGYEDVHEMVTKMCQNCPYRED